MIAPRALGTAEADAADRVFSTAPRRRAVVVRLARRLSSCAIASDAKSNRGACFEVLLCVPGPVTLHPGYASTGCAFRPHLRVTYGAVTLLLSVLSGE